ncbi:hypothetical protein BDV26DRAFT_276353 [Aspergillus bertholletiae]|uniref:Uncharacterized protein n=1 Tax=Aspergillus bertholletiae TaxID=1226010 RepID=A0A5N7AN73_9EURO|nr:hypothetical protein BDV26DRAFT_276353 [Aspergillus bertholletiae]
MRLLTLSVACLGLNGCIAASPPNPDDITANADHGDSPSPCSVAPGHEIHLPCHMSSICGDQSESSSSDSYLALAFCTDNDSLKVNNNTILPAHLPMRLIATKYSGPEKATAETLTLRYGMNILPVQRFHAGPIADQFRLDIILFDQSGHPTDTNMISVGLSRDTHDALRITMITINPSPEGARYHGHGGRRHGHSARSPPTSDDSSESESRLDKWLDAGRAFGRKGYGSFTSGFKSRPCKSHCSDQSSYLPSSYRQGRVPLVDILRVFYPAIFPFLLGVVAGGAICLIGVMVRRSAAYRSCVQGMESEQEGSDSGDEGDGAEEK